MPSGRPQGGTNREFAGAAGGANQHQARYVGARNQKNKPHGSQQDEHLRAEIAASKLSERLHHHAPFGTSNEAPIFWIAICCTLAQQAHEAGSRIQIEAWTKARNDSVAFVESVRR